MLALNYIALLHRVDLTDCQKEQTILHAKDMATSLGLHILSSTLFVILWELAKCHRK